MNEKQKRMKKSKKFDKTKTKKENYNLSLAENPFNIERKNLMDLKGKIKFLENYNYKSLRNSE